MNKIAFALCALFVSHLAFADAACDAKAAEKKLAGAAKTTFLKKCEKDANAAAPKAAAPAAEASDCAAKATDKKLAGAAKSAFMPSLPLPPPRRLLPLRPLPHPTARPRPSARTASRCTAPPRPAS